MKDSIAYIDFQDSRGSARPDEARERKDESARPTVGMDGRMNNKSRARERDEKGVERCFFCIASRARVCLRGKDSEAVEESLGDVKGGRERETKRTKGDGERDEEEAERDV